MLKEKAVMGFGMRLESVALALLSQALRAGFQSKPEAIPWAPPTSFCQNSEIFCNCTCHCGGGRELLAFGFGVLGTALVWIIWCGCKFSSSPVIYPSPRRKGYGVISEPLPWSSVGSVLQ